MVTKYVSHFLFKFIHVMKDWFYSVQAQAQHGDEDEDSCIVRWWLPITTASGKIVYFDVTDKKYNMNSLERTK